MTLSKVRHAQSAFSTFILDLKNRFLRREPSSTGASFAIMDRWHPARLCNEEITDAQDVRDDRCSHPCPTRRRWMRVEERVHEDGSGRRGRQLPAQARARRCGPG